MKADRMSNSSISNISKSDPWKSDPWKSDTSSIREWMVPPLLVPVLFGLLVVAAVLVQW